MRVYNFHYFVIGLFLLVSCQPHMDGSFCPFQTFNEFEMKELGADNVCEPYLFIRRTTDTIMIVRSDQRKDTMVYLNKGDFWYSSVRINYNYTLVGKLKNLLRTPAWDTDYMQIDVYRYITKNSVVEAYFHNDGECNINEMGLRPDYITIYNHNCSRSYEFFDNLDNVLDSTILGNTTIWKIYQNRRHKLSSDTTCFDYTLYYHVLSTNTFYMEHLSTDGEVIIEDSVLLNSLGIYHVPTYQFSIDESNYQTGVNGDKMRIDISCTTLETDKYFNNDN